MPQKPNRHTAALNLTHSPSPLSPNPQPVTLDVVEPEGYKASMKAPIIMLLPFYAGAPKPACSLPPPPFAPPGNSTPVLTGRLTPSRTRPGHGPDELGDALFEVERLRFVEHYSASHEIPGAIASCPLSGSPLLRVNAAQRALTASYWRTSLLSPFPRPPAEAVVVRPVFNTWSLFVDGADDAHESYMNEARRFLYPLLSLCLFAPARSIFALVASSRSALLLSSPVGHACADCCYSS